MTALTERGPGIQFNKDAAALGIALAQPETALLDLPDPMPGLTPDGVKVWLHWRPLRWERHP